MNKKNKIVCLLGILCLCTGLLFGCKNSKNDTFSNGKISVVCTIFPEYDWARELVGNLKNEYQLTMLLDNGVDLHSYQPTAKDIAQIAACDVFIYVGGESDEWVEDALKESTNKNMHVINLLDVLKDSVKEEEVVEGMQEELTEQEEVVDEHIHDEDEVEYDEHVWLSLNNAKEICKTITEALKNIDEKNANQYEENYVSYVEELSQLDTQYKNVISESKHKAVLLGDRFPFRYMVDDYNLDYYAAFVGCSAEIEASFDTVVFLAEKMDELGLSNIVTLENSDQKIAKTIVDNTKNKNQKIQRLDSMQSITSKDVDAGKTYLSVMKSNLDVLKVILN